jgi:hypothetical protein
MPFELGANTPGAIANSRGFRPQFGIIDHFLDVAEPIGPVQIISARQRCKLTISTLIESSAAGTDLPVGRAAAPIASLSRLSTALLTRLSLAIATTLSAGLLLARL